MNLLWDFLLRVKLGKTVDFSKVQYCLYIQVRNM
jgi:hypothetical protein